MIRLRNLAIYLLFITNIIVGQQPTYYLNPNKKLYQYQLETWSTANGLPTNSLLNICQSKQGYLWISSYDGLIRFDGHRFHTFHQYNTKELQSNTIRKIAEANDGTLWMTTQGSGLVSLKDNKFASYGLDINLSNLYRALYIDKGQRIWSASPDSGWFYFKNDTFNFLQHTESLKEIELRSISEDSTGAMWFGTLGHGLFKYKNGQFENFTREHGLPNNWIYKVFTDRKGKLWVGSNSGLSYIEHSEFKTFDIKGIGSVTDIIQDAYGNLWLSSTTGLYRINIKNGLTEHLNSDRGLKHNFINDLIIDSEGNLWMANYKGGLSQLKDGKFTNYTAKGGLHGKVVNAVCELDSHRYIAAFDNGKLSLIDNGELKPYRTKTNLLGKRIRHILMDKSGNIWYSTYSGLLKVDANGTEIWHNRYNGFPGTQIRLCYEDNTGTIWVGTRNHGLIRINKDNTYTVFDACHGLSGNLIMSIGQTSENQLIIGTSEGAAGVSIISGDKIIRTYSKAKGMISDIVFNTYTDSQGIIWLAVNGGLCCIKDNKITNYTVKDGLSDDTPFDILEDNNGSFWLPCSKGIMVVSRSELLDFSEGRANKITCILLDEHDGMNQSECNPTTKSLKSTNGTFLFPTIDGIAQIDPSNLLRNNFVPPVIIEDLVVDNIQLNNLEEAIISPSSKRLTFQYTALSLYEPEKIFFKYKLDGFEEEWTDNGNLRTVSYTNLSPGNYTLRVIASNNDGVWNNRGASYKFTVEPHVYETSWFIILIGLLVLKMIYLFYRYRISKLKQYQLELKTEVDKRTEEILVKNAQLETQKNEIEKQAAILEAQKEELKISNASKDKLFSIIGHDLRGPLGNFKTILDIVINETENHDHSERQEMLRMLSENAKASYDLLENLLNWSVSQQGIINFNPKVFHALNIVEDIISIVTPMAAKKEISIVNKVDNAVLVNADLDMTRLIFRNLISNAVKFTPSKGEVVISAKNKSTSYVEFGIKDNGIGIKDELKENIFNHMANTLHVGTKLEKGSGLGLILCKEFVERNNGEIRVESNYRKGSTFYFTLKRAQ